MISIWLKEKKGNNTSILTRNRIKIVDIEKYNAIMEELRDYKNYIDIKTGKTYEEINKKEYLGYKRIYDTGIEIYEKEENDRYGYDYVTVRWFENPRNYIALLMSQEERNMLFTKELQGETINENYNFSLSSLINGNIDEMETIIDIIIKSNISREEKINLLNTSFIQFGYFITRCLDCIEIEVCDEYSIEEIRNKIRFIEKELEIYQQQSGEMARMHTRIFNEELKFYKTILSKHGLAIQNQRVLKLARKMQQNIK